MSRQTHTVKRPSNPEAQPSNQEYSPTEHGTCTSHHHNNVRGTAVEQSTWQAGSDPLPSEEMSCRDSNEARQASAAGFREILELSMHHNQMEPSQSTGGGPTCCGRVSPRGDRKNRFDLRTEDRPKPHTTATHRRRTWRRSQCGASVLLDFVPKIEVAMLQTKVRGTFLATSGTKRCSPHDD